MTGRKKKVTVYGFHSLRHSFVSFCAEAGVPVSVVLSIVGADSDIVSKHYTHIGEDAQALALKTVFGDSNELSDHEKIEKALELIDSCKDDLPVLKKLKDLLL